MGLRLGVGLCDPYIHAFAGLELLRGVAMVQHADVAHAA